MQFGAYSSNGDKLKDHIEQGSSSWCVNNLKQSGLSASVPSPYYDINITHQSPVALPQLCNQIDCLAYLLFV
jgi:hypothetical protein